MDKYFGKLMRNMSPFSKIINFSSSGMWSPPVDVYETDDEILVYIDVAGVDPEKLSVTADRKSLVVSGERKFPLAELRRIHQLEIEYGFFKRVITLPAAVNVHSTVSSCKDGFLIVRLPKLVEQGKVQIKLS